MKNVRSVRLFKKFISITLIVALLASMIPFKVMANSVTVPEYSKNTIESNNQNDLEYSNSNTTKFEYPITQSSGEVTDNILYQNINDQTAIMQEDESKRTMYSKTFLIGNGQYYVAMYSEPVHFLESGKWNEIDSTLAESKNNGKTVYKNNHAPFNVEFSVSDDQDKLASISKDGYNVSWDISECNVNASNGKATKTEKHKFLKNKIKVKKPLSFDTNDKTVLKNKVSAITYSDAFTNTDLAYTVSTNQVKEDIILKNKKDITDYAIDLTTTLNATLNDDNSINLTNETGDVIFTIQSPYMYDSNDASSNAILVTLNKTESGWKIIISPDRDWLEDKARVWPVTIDPSFYNDSPHVWDTYATPGGTVDHRNEEKMYIGNYSNKLCRAYLKYEDLTQDKTGVDIGEGSVINSATLKLYLNPITSSWGNINLYRTNSTYVQGMSDSNKVTNVTSLATNVAPSNLVYTMNVTSTVQQWFDGAVANNGFMIRYYNEGLDDYNAIMTSENDDTSLRPSLTFTYTRDTTPPTEPTKINLSWTGASQKSTVDINSISGSTDSGADVDYYQYQLNGGTWTKYTGATTLTLKEGLNNILARAVDKVGNISDTFSTSIRKDTISPTTPSSIALSWTGASQNATVNINSISGSTDNNGSGIDYYQYQLNDGTWTTFSVSTSLSLVEGINTIAARAVDNVGKPSGAYSVQVRKDTTAPTAPTSVSLSWTGVSQNSTVTVNSISGSTDNNGSGVDYYQYQLNGGAWTTFSAAPTLVLVEGLNTISVRSVDNVGKVSAIYSTTVRKDTTAPYTPTSISLSWTGVSQNSTVTINSISGSTDNNGSGVDYYQYQLNGGTWTTFSVAKSLSLVEGINTISAKSFDKAGKPSGVYSVQVRKDTIPPTAPTSVSLSWTGVSRNSTVTVNSISGSTDINGSSIAYYQYKLNGGTWTKYTGATVLNLNEGLNTIATRSVDNAEIPSTTYSTTVRKDTVAPTAPTNYEKLGMASPSGNVLLGISDISGGKDLESIGGPEGGSGIDYYQYQLNSGTWTKFTTLISFVEGENIISARSVDKAGNISLPYSITERVDTIAPTITLTSSGTWATSDTISTEIKDSNSGIDPNSIKWAYGSFGKANFPVGNAFDGTSFEVKASGVYTVYAKDKCGNAAVQTITVSNVYSAPSLGNYTYSATDFSIDSPGYTMEFTRTYNSFNDSASMFGKGWSFSFQGKCKDYTYSYIDFYGTRTSSISNLKIVSLPDGNNYFFKLDGNNYIGQNTRDTLIKNTDNTFTLTDMDRRSYHFSTYGYLDTITDRNGNKVSITVDGTGKISKITDSVGRIYILTPNEDGTIDSITDPAGRIFSYEYENGNLTKSISPTKKTVEGYEYDDSSNYLTKVKDAFENTIQGVAYKDNNNNRLDSITDNENNTTTYQYDDSTNSVTSTDSEGNEVIKIYDNFMRLISTSDGTKITESTSYDNNYNDVDKLTDSDGNITDYDYYSDGNIKNVKITNSSGCVIEDDAYTYIIDNLGNITQSVKTTISTYLDIEGAATSNNTTIMTTNNDSKGNVLTQVVNNGINTSTTLKIYKDNGNIETETADDGLVTSYTYDKYGYPESTTVQTYNANGSITNTETDYTYNIIGQNLTTVENGRCTENIYDLRGNVIKQTIDGEVTRTVYDNYGRVIHEIPSNKYDGNKNIDIIVPDNNGISIKDDYTDSSVGKTYDYDNNNNVIRLNNFGQITRNLYDSNNRIIQRIQPDQYAPGSDGLNDPSSSNTYRDSNVGDRYVYDGLGNITSHTDKAGNVTINDYMNSNLVKSSCNGLITRYVYNGGTKLLQVIYPNQYVAANDRLNLFTKPQVDNYIQNVGDRYTYDSNGNVLTHIDSQGNITDNTYDTNNHLVKSVTNDKVTRYVYDGGNNLLQVIFPDQYKTGEDELDLTAAPQVDKYINLYVGKRYTYDDMGKLLTMTDINGKITSYQYNEKGTLSFTSSSDGSSKVYDTKNTIQNETYPNGVKNTITYDSDNIIKNITGSNKISTNFNFDNYGEVGYSFKYGDNSKNYIYKYDSNGNIISITLDGILQVEYKYDLQNELVQENNKVQMQIMDYSYDSLGNIKSKIVHDEAGVIISTCNYQYDKTNTLDNWNNKDLTYFDNGNLKSFNDESFTWDNGKLSTCTNAGNVTSYTYNHNNIRDSKTVQGVTTNYTLDENNNIIEQNDGKYDIKFFYNYAGSPQYFTLQKNGETCLTYYYEINLQGDIIGILDSSNNEIVTYSYDAWGNILKVSDSTDDKVGNLNPLRYRGYYYDSESGLYYLQTRYYSPELCRFISADDPSYSNSQGEPIGSNLYAYCLNNPIINADPSGKCTIGDIINNIGKIFKDLVKYIDFQICMKTVDKYLNGDKTDINTALNTLADYTDIKLNTYSSKMYSKRNYQKYDKFILGWVCYYYQRRKWEIDPEMIKAMMYIESHMGYSVSSSPNANIHKDVMQVLDPRNPTVYELTNIDSKGGDAIKVIGPKGKYVKLSSMGYKPGKPSGMFIINVAKRLFSKDKNFYVYQYGKSSPTLSIGLGIYWYHKQLADTIRNPIGDPYRAAELYNIGDKNYVKKLKDIRGGCDIDKY